MEPTTVISISWEAVAILLVGFSAGMLTGFFVLPGQRKYKQLEEQVETLEREQAEYQASVSDHFQKTGQLVGEMTRSYKAVYDHLADGAQTLVRVPPADQTLPFSDNRIAELGGPDGGPGPVTVTSEEDANDSGGKFSGGDLSSGGQASAEDVLVEAVAADASTDESDTAADEEERSPV